MTIPAKASVTNDLKTKHPCRDSQFDALTCLLGHESLPSPPAICLTGLKNSGKRTILRAAVDSLATPQQAVQSTWVDCRETFSSHLLFDRIVNRINAMKQPQPTERIKVLNDINSFVVEVTRALNAIEGKFILVLENADCTADLNPDSLFSVLARLPTLTFCPNLTVIFIATFFSPRLTSGLPIPTIHFPPYTKSQLIRILALQTPESVYDYSTIEPDWPGDLDDPELQKVWEGLVSAVIDTFGPGTALDIPTILNLSRTLWPDFVEPIIKAGILCDDGDEIVFGKVDFVGLFTLAKRKGLFSGEEIVKKQTTLTTARVTVRHELPYYSKFLLISAFLASYNPTKDDARIFARDSGMKRKARRAGHKSNKGIAKMSQRLIGPRVFDLERMIAIFHSITSYEVKQTVDVQMQIATLGSLKLILRTNRGDPLAGGGRWKVNVGEEEVRRIAGSVRFSLNDYLVD